MQKKQNNTGLIWFRNNLRTEDNASLKKAVENCNKVIAVYCFDPKLFRIDEFGFQKTAKFRAQFLIETIADLKQNLANFSKQQNKPINNITMQLDGRANRQLHGHVDTRRKPPR